jgi:hypothetical protein
MNFGGFWGGSHTRVARLLVDYVKDLDAIDINTRILGYALLGPLIRTIY